MVVDLTALSGLRSLRELRVTGRIVWCSPAVLNADGLGALTQLTALTWNYVNPVSGSGKLRAQRANNCGGGEHA